MRMFKSNRKILFIIPSIIVILLISLFCLPIKNGRSIFSSLVYKRRVNASIQPQNYDKLKVTNVTINSRITGTENFDTPDGHSVEDGSILSNMDGIDVSAKDDYVRTADLVQYSIEVSIDRNENTTTPDEVIMGGIIKVRVTFPEDPGVYGYFDFLKDPWMLARVESGNVLTGYYKLPDDRSAVGGTQELVFSFNSGSRVAHLTSQQMPIFEVWMEGNQPDNSSSAIDSATIQDGTGINITAIPEVSLYLQEGGINHKSIRNGVIGNYINFGVTFSDRQFKVGTMIPRSPITSKIRIEYYYRIKGTSNWIKIEEGDPKATDIINGTQLVAYGKACADTPGFWPGPEYNKGYGPNSYECGYGRQMIGQYSINGLNGDDTSSYDTGDVNAELNGNVLSFTNPNYLFIGKNPRLLFYDGFELFVPYYDYGGAEYEYQIKLIDYELSFADDLGNIHTITPNRSLTKQLYSELSGNILGEFNYGQNLNGHSIYTNNHDYVSAYLGEKAYFYALSNVNDGNYEGGKDTIITIDASAVSLDKLAYADGPVDFNYDNNGSFPTPSKDNVIVKYGIYKSNPNVGLDSDELVNNAVYEDFDWYEDFAEAKEHGKPTAIYINEPENKGNKLRSSCKFQVEFTTDQNAINYMGMMKQKVRYYGDADRTEVYTWGYDEEYHKTTINPNVTTYGTPETLGQSYLISPYRAYIRINDFPITNTPHVYIVNDEYVTLELEPSLISNTSLDDSIRGNFKVSAILNLNSPYNLSYKMNSANIEPDEVIDNGNGTTTINWYFNDWQANMPLPKIYFDVALSKYVANNSQFRVDAYLYDLSTPAHNAYNSENWTGTIINLSGTSLAKEVDDNYIDKNTNFTITDHIYNISQSALANIKTFEILPKNNDDLGSKFSGSYTIHVDSLAEGQNLYYTTVNINNIPFEQDSLGNNNIRSLDLANDSRFIEVHVGDTIPSNATMLASTITSLVAMSDKGFSYTIIPTGNATNDKYVSAFYATTDNLETTLHSPNVTIYVADRAITGVAFIDADGNNEYNSSGDTLLSNISLDLLDENQMKIGETITDSTGRYTFNELDPGHYYVRFNGKEGFLLIPPGTTDNSNKFNTNGLTNKLTNNENLYKPVVAIENINLGLRTKQAHLTVKHLEKGTNQVLVPQEDRTVYYTDEYITMPSTAIPANYIFDSTDGDEPIGTVSKENIEVIYYYTLKSSVITAHHYIDGTTTKIAEDVTQNKKYMESYTTIRLDTTNLDYEYVRTDGDPETGTVSKDNYDVNYYYKLKQGTVITHHYLYQNGETTTKLAPDVERTWNYTETYTTSISDEVSDNYELYKKSDNYTGIVQSATIEVSYYYQLKNSNLNTSITLEGTDEITAKDEEVNYKITYNASLKDYIGNGTITIIDTLPYKIDVSKSEIAGGTYDENTKTITWVEEWNGIDSYNSPNETSTKEIVKNLKLVYVGIVGRDRIMVNNALGRLELSNNSRDITASKSTNIRIKGNIKIMYIDKYANEEIFETIEKSDLVGETFVSSAKTKDGYILVEKPNTEEYYFEEEDQTFKYLYEHIKFEVRGVVLGTGGGSISGDEDVYWGGNSTENKIVIEAEKGYVIGAVYINGVKQDIESFQEKIILHNFENILENKKIEVSFVKSPAKENPPTGATISITLIILSLIVSLILFKKGKVLNKLPKIN